VVRRAAPRARSRRGRLRPGELSLQAATCQPSCRGLPGRLHGAGILDPWVPARQGKTTLEINRLALEVEPPKIALEQSSPPAY